MGPAPASAAHSAQHAVRWDAPAEFRLLHLQVKPNTPVLMCSVPGYDASGHVEDLAAEQNTQITSIAIGKGARSLPGLTPTALGLPRLLC